MKWNNLNEKINKKDQWYGESATITQRTEKPKPVKKDQEASVLRLSRPTPVQLLNLSATKKAAALSLMDKSN